MKKLNFEFIENVTCPYCGFKENTVSFNNDQTYPFVCYCEGSEGGCDEMFVVTCKHTFTITPMVAKIGEFNKQLKIGE